MISALSGASGSPSGGGMRAITASSTSVDALAGLGAARGSRPVAGMPMTSSISLDHALGLRRGQVDLVEHRHHLDALLGGGVAVGDGLRLHALRGVDHEQRALAGRQRARHFVGEVDVARACR